MFTVPSIHLFGCLSLCLSQHNFVKSQFHLYDVQARWQELKSGSGTEYECLTVLIILASSDFLSYCNTYSQQEMASDDTQPDDWQACNVCALVS